MNNTKQLAYPQPIAFHPESPNAQTSWGVHEDFAGFTKLEMASLMIAQGMASTWLQEANTPQYKRIAGVAVDIAKAVLEEANK